ncbi:SUMF1/EgtB/PvdO family nonheme iron enzyme [Desulfovibrio sp.]|uniref:formylglycine-generating enzyme family protein n=1 Tax=Desulfovibrio sp. TaxID=885 RepID=UPI0023D6B52E|nr:SUMF1/EgtB/PvdO family nonheme iron enzyme [Desulfovibrio sp.]MDE7242233.1 SUMF1/EgtB/PvdO family nonheme iron enzyme [Desulfovibrio sp.]
MPAPLVLLLLLLLAGAQPALAAFTSANDGVPVESAWNPVPAGDDIALPMPCGLSMTLRAVAVPSGGLIKDRTFSMGVVNAQEGERQIYERQFDGHIAAPFTSADLPAAWGIATGGTGKKAAGDTFYFIGKYEVSRLQWDAVMRAVSDDGSVDEAACPVKGKTAPAGANLPQGGVSWFDAQQFLQKYNAWLVREHPGSLPHFAGTKNVGFLRLPTEEEWEFAARGGAGVAPEWWADKDVFPLAEGKALKDYGVYSADGALSGPSPIGSRNANPLGLHDTLGNVREMTDGFFRLSIADMQSGMVRHRLHGAAGGVLVKGGSFRSDEAGVAPGRRDEVPLYTAQGPSRPEDLGLRLVLSGINIPNAERLETLRKEERAPAQKPGTVQAGRTPLEAVEALSAAAPALKPQLDQLRAMLEDQESAATRERAATLEHEYRSLLYQAETLRAFAFRYSAAHRQEEKIREMLKKNSDAATKKQLEQLRAEVAGDLKDYLDSLRMGAGYYKTSLGLVGAAPETETERLAAQARREYGGAGVFNTHMKQNIDVLEKWLSEARSKGAASLSVKAILKGILPEQHYKVLPL